MEKSTLLTIGVELFVAINVIAIYHSVQAVRHLNAQLPGAFGEFLKRGPFARKEVFSERGWRHRNMAIAIHSLAFFVAAVFIAMS